MPSYRFKSEVPAEQIDDKAILIHHALRESGIEAYKQVMVMLSPNGAVEVKGDGRYITLNMVGLGRPGPWQAHVSKRNFIENAIRKEFPDASDITVGRRR